MGNHIDPFGDICSPSTDQNGSSHIGVVPPQPAQPTAGAVAAAAVVEALHRLERKVDALAALMGPEAAAQVQAAAAGPRSLPAAAAGAPAAAAAQAGSEGSGAAAAAAAAGGNKAKQQEPFSFPNFGGMSVQAAAKWWCSPLADHITAKETEEDCKGWTPEQLQAEGKAAWRGGGHGPRYQRWAEWVQLMRYVAAKQFQLSQDKGEMASLQEAAAAVDVERGSWSLTQLYKQVVKPWAAQQEEERKQRLLQQQQQGKEEEEQQEEQQ
jgi:hypothetical protein